MKTIKQYSEYSEDYPAIDGIAKEQRPSKGEIEKKLQQNPSASCSFLPLEKPIRSDVEKILEMNSADFDSWYNPREKAILDILTPMRLIKTIPHLGYGAEDQQYSLTAYSSVSSLCESLEKGLEYLEVIKRVRKAYQDQYKKTNITKYRKTHS